VKAHQKIADAAISAYHSAVAKAGHENAILDGVELPRLITLLQATQRSEKWVYSGKGAIVFLTQLTFTIAGAAARYYMGSGTPQP